MTEKEANEKLKKRHDLYFNRYAEHITKYAAVVKKSLNNSVDDDYVIELGIKGIGIKTHEHLDLKENFDLIQKRLNLPVEIIDDIVIKQDTIPKPAEDITYMHDLFLNESNEEYKKLTSGISICNKHYSTVKGTLFKTIQDHEIYLLTNQHVALGNINDVISHVFIKDSLKTYNDIGPLYWKEDCKNGILDVAIVKIVNYDVEIGKYSRSEHLKLRGINTPKIGDNVRKCGRSSEMTYGEIRSINCTINISNNLGTINIFKNQIMTTNMIIGGDSGSVLVNHNDEVVGLFFAGNYMGSFANNINEIFAKVNNDHKDFIFKKFV